MNVYKSLPGPFKGRERARAYVYAYAFAMFLTKEITRGKKDKNELQPTLWSTERRRRVLQGYI